MKTGFTVNLACAFLVVLGSTGCVKSNQTGDQPFDADSDASIQTDNLDAQGRTDGTESEVGFDARDSLASDTTNINDAVLPCSHDADCISKCVNNGQHICPDGGCHQCCTDDDCNHNVVTDRWFCNGKYECQDVPGDCDNLCPRNQPFCSTTSNKEQCVECLVDADCDRTGADGTTHVGSPFCVAVSGIEKCVQCRTDADCSAAGGNNADGIEKPVCAVISKIQKCVQCRADADCTEISPACTCSEADGWSCLMQFGTSCQKDILQCKYPEDLPTSWGPAGVASYIYIPANAEEKAACYDYTGDGMGDCGLTGFASQINPPLADMINAGTVAVILEFNDVEDLADNPGFSLFGITGSPVPEGAMDGDVYLDTEDYLFSPDTCKPAFRMNATIAYGILSGAADKVTVRVHITAGLEVPVDLIDVHIRAELAASGPGVEASYGLISGVFTKAELTEIRDGIQQACDMDPQPAEVADICPYLQISPMAIMIFDLHQMEDGTYINKDAENPGDATSVCFKFTLAPAKIVGYRPAN